MAPEQQILEDCKKGKNKAMDRLYDKYSKPMLGVCMRYCRNREEAEDVLQEGFIKIFLSIKNFKFRAEGSLTGWIKRIIVNTAINHHRDNLKHYYHTDIGSISDPADEEPDYNTGQTQEEPVSPEKIMEIVQNLPPGYRMVFNLYVFEKYTHKDIAEELKISENTSKTQLLKARKMIKQKIAEIRIIPAVI